MAAYSQYYASDYSALEYGQENPSEAFFESQRERGLGILEYLRSNGRLPPPGSRVLEVGCNSGGILKAFRDEGYEVRGVDLNARFTQYGREAHGLDLKFGTIQDIEHAWQPSLIVYSHTFEHVTRPVEELRAIRGVLRDGGAVYVQVPGIKNLRDGYSMDFRSYIQFAHTYHFSLKTLTSLFCRNGFQLLCGDEVVNAVFEKSESDSSYSSDYAAVLTYLNTAERARRMLRMRRVVGTAYRMFRSRLRP